MDKADVTRETAVSTSESQSDATENVKQARKKFIVPEISVPVDVLEATTFFQTADSGPTT